MYRRYTVDRNKSDDAKNYKSTPTDYVASKNLDIVYMHSTSNVLIRIQEKDNIQQYKKHSVNSTSNEMTPELKDVVNECVNAIVREKECVLILPDFMTNQVDHEENPRDKKSRTSVGSSNTTSLMQIKTYQVLDESSALIPNTNKYKTSVIEQFDTFMDILTTVNKFINKCKQEINTTKEALTQRINEWDGNTAFGESVQTRNQETKLRLQKTYEEYEKFAKTQYDGFKKEVMQTMYDILKTTEDV